MIRKSEVEAALASVMDPCSVFNRTNLSIVDLGFIDEVSIEKGTVDVRLFLDDPTCIYFFEIVRMLKEAVMRVDGVEEVEVDIKYDEIWTESRMRPDARERLEALRAKRQEAFPVPISGRALPMAPSAGGAGGARP